MVIKHFIKVMLTMTYDLTLLVVTQDGIVHVNASIPLSIKYLTEVCFIFSRAVVNSIAL